MVEQFKHVGLWRIAHEIGCLTVKITSFPERPYKQRGPHDSTCRHIVRPARAEMSERFYYWNPMSIDRYDLVINTGVLDLDTAVDVIVAAYQAKAARTIQPIA